MDIDLLHPIPLFAALSREERNQLGNLLTRKEIAAHRTVFWIGEPGSEFCIVQSGQVEVVQPDEQGKELPLGRIGPGSFFGELSLLDEGPRTATVRTTRDSVFLTLGRPEFRQFVERHPSAALHMLAELGKRQRDMLQMLRSVQNVNQVIDERLTAEQRIADTLAAWIGSWVFLIVQTILFALWIVTNVVAREGPGQWDPYPFSLLSLVLATVSGFAAPIILMSQYRQGQKDRIKAELEYQVNVKAHHEVMHLHQKMDQLLLQRSPR